MATVTNRGDFDGTKYFTYDGPHVVEERNGSNQMTQEYVYGPEHIDQPIMIFGENGTSFVYQGLNWSVMGLTNPAGDLVEEYNYTPYGKLLARTHTKFGDFDGDGDLDTADNSIFTSAYGSSAGDPEWNRNCDADYDGDVDSFDQAAFNKNYNAAGTSAVVVNRGWSSVGNPYTFTARRLDAETGLMHYRFRTYNPDLHRFLQRDPLGYVDGPNAYEYCGGNPLGHVDPWGLQNDPQVQQALQNEFDKLTERISKKLGSIDYAKDKLEKAHDSYDKTLSQLEKAEADLSAIQERIDGIDMEGVAGLGVSIFATFGGLAAAPVTGGLSLLVTAAGVVGMGLTAKGVGEDLGTAYALERSKRTGFDLFGWLKAERTRLNALIARLEEKLARIQAQINTITEEIYELEDELGKLVDQMEVFLDNKFKNEEYFVLKPALQQYSAHSPRAASKSKHRGSTTGTGRYRPGGINVRSSWLRDKYQKRDWKRKEFNLPCEP